MIARIPAGRSASTEVHEKRSESRTAESNSTAVIGTPTNSEDLVAIMAKVTGTSVTGHEDSSPVPLTTRRYRRQNASPLSDVGETTHGALNTKTVGDTTQSALESSPTSFSTLVKTSQTQCPGQPPMNSAGSRLVERAPHTLQPRGLDGIGLYFAVFVPGSFIIILAVVGWYIYKKKYRS
ncbi:hypothetical protein TWF481_002213 [Arthrobotrys musiformis]|uniref:Uncharacterized protein n=1 Tax=Arthrobotrys musiformis TaxID=47236 RepID=A0AAV9VUJ4_9PEZI